MWTVNDFLAYGLISGQQTKGYHNCPCCGLLTDSKKIRGPIGEKVVFLRMKKQLVVVHKYMSNKKFNGNKEHGTAPPSLSNGDILRYATKRQVYLNNGGAFEGKDDPIHYIEVKRRSILYSLPYYKVSGMF
jgi:hypothetical protein